MEVATEPTPKQAGSMINKMFGSFKSNNIKDAEAAS